MSDPQPVRALEGAPATSSHNGAVLEPHVAGDLHVAGGRADARGRRWAVLPMAAPRGRGGRPWRGFVSGAFAVTAALAAADMAGWVQVKVHVDPLAAVRGALGPNVAGATGNGLLGVGAAEAANLEPAAAPATGSLPAAVEIAAVGAQVDTLSLLTSAAMLGDAVRTSRPYIAELALAFKVADGDPVLLAPLDRLAPWAETGAATADELIQRFQGLTRQINAVNTPAVGWMTRSVRLFTRDLPVLLGVSETSRSDWQRALERAATAVERGALGEAARALKALDEPTIELVQPWVRDVDVRLAVETEARRFHREAVGRALGHAG